MSELGDPRAELLGIQAAITAQTKLRGILPDEQVDLILAALQEKAAAARVRLEGSGAFASGAGAQAVGAGGVLIAGGVHVTSPPPGPGVDPACLRDAYLNRLVQEAGTLSLAGIDPAAAGGEAETLLDLAAVYTALWTLSPAAEQRMGREIGVEAAEDEPRQLSALAQLDRHDRLVLLGDPGSGKSTFVNCVALCMAGELTGHPRAHLELLRSPMPAQEEEEAQPQPWSHGALLPVRIVLRDFAAGGLPSTARRATAEDLWRFVAGSLEEASLGEYAPWLYKELRETGGLVLLDGLDEVPEAEHRREQIRGVVEDFARSFPKCRFLLTSRTYAYQGQGWRLKGFAEVVLAPFDEAQIRSFVTRWYAHAAALGRLGQEDAAGKAELLRRAIAGSSRLGELAERPLLLTLMASLHAWRGGSLPERREQLYADAVDLLLNLWESRRVKRDVEGRPVLMQPSLAQYLAVGKDEVRQVLEGLAFDVHAAQGDREGTADVPEGELVGRLMGIGGRNAEVNPAELVRYLSQRAGLLISRGVGVYTFPHRTFQEYLAACHLTGEEFPVTVADLGRCDPGRWREVVLLAGAKAARGAGAAVWLLADHLCLLEPDDPRAGLEDAWGAHFAGQAVVESADLGKVGEVNRPKLSRLRRWHVHLLRSGQLPAAERALAGKTLARLGDPRFDPERWYLPREPRLGFLEVPAGPFRIGEEEDEHEVVLPAFWIARFPVTVAQFRAFVEASGYEANPRSLEGVANHPVNYVSWHDAEAYCRWLGDRLQELAATGGAAEASRAEPRFWGGIASGEVRLALPSEEEWEKSARGTDGRCYPWGEKADPELANYYDTGLHEPSTMGCFPGGASPYGAEEMSGNVWEWTRSEFETEEKDRFGLLRVLRGGSCFLNSRDVRCAVRFRLVPADRYGGLGFRVVFSPFSSDL